MDAGFKRELKRKVRAGERLTCEDGVALYESNDLARLGGGALFPRVGRDLRLAGDHPGPVGRGLAGPG